MFILDKNKILILTIILIAIISVKVGAKEENEKELIKEFIVNMYSPNSYEDIIKAKEIIKPIMTKECIETFDIKNDYKEIEFNTKIEFKSVLLGEKIYQEDKIKKIYVQFDTTIEDKLYKMDIEFKFNENGKIYDCDFL